MSYNNAIQTINALRDENQDLKQVLMAHGIFYRSATPDPSIGHGTQISRENSNGKFNSRESREQSIGHATSTYELSIGHATSTYAASSHASTSGTRVDNAGLSPVPMSPPGSSTSLPTMQDMNHQRAKSEIARSPQTVNHHVNMDHDQLGVEFVLA